MNDAVDVLIFLEDGKSVIEITEVNLVVFYGFPCDLLNTFQHRGVRPGIIINADHFVTILNQVNYSMRTYITATSRNQYFCHLRKLRRKLRKLCKKKADDVKNSSCKQGADGNG